MEKYITENDKAYRRCSYCNHCIGANNTCELFHCSCGNNEGCTEEIIRKGERGDI